MVRKLAPEFLPIDERIRLAGAERSVEVGYAIGEGLAAFSRALSTMFVAPTHPSHRAVSRAPVAHRLATRR